MKLIKKPDGKYVAVDRGVQIEGTWEQVASTLVVTYHYEGEELDSAKVLMDSLKHDTADFGIAGSLITTYSSVSVERILLELNAIKQARQIFKEEHAVNPESLLTKTAYDRLMYLYFALNVDAVIHALEEPRDLAA